MAYSKTFIDNLIANYNPSETTIVKYAVDNGVGERQMRKWLKSGSNRKRDAAESEKHPHPDFLKKLGKDINPVNILEKLAERVDEHGADDKDYCRIAVKTNKPIVVIKAADLHLGGLDVDYKTLLEHYKLLLNEDRFYLQLFGDDINMMIMHKTTAARHDALTPDEQCDLLVGMVTQLLDNGKLLSMASGNHSDEFTERSAGFGLVKLLVSKKVPYFSAMGYIDLQVGDFTYPMGFVHKTRYHSFMNAVHGNKRLQQCHAEYFGVNRPIAREYITAHTHYPAVSMEGCLPEDRIYYIKCGTFKTDDLYSRRYFGKGRIGCPSVVYYPDRLEHICLPTPQDAYKYITGKDLPGLKNSEKK